MGLLIEVSIFNEIWSKYYRKEKLGYNLNGPEMDRISLMIWNDIYLMDIGLSVSSLYFNAFALNLQQLYI